MRILTFLLAGSLSCSAQTYPRWFLEPVNLGCAGAASGCASLFFRQGSSDSAAYAKACENLARQHYIEFRGGEAYWETEAGMYWMGNDFTEKIDSAYLDDVTSQAKKLSEYRGREMTIVLVTDRDCTIADSMLAIDKCPPAEPDWVEAVPQRSGYVYAEGVSPGYFYESSSWETAEKRARFNLARNIKVSLRAIQKVDESSGQQISNEQVSVVLRDIGVVYRWRDIHRDLYFVLVRMPIR